jgi:uncharacterized protein DUF6916
MTAGELQTLEAFSAHVGGRFQMHVDDGAVVDLVLIEARDHGRKDWPQGLRRPFSLLFRGPGNSQATQGTYRIEHDVLGAIELFLVPIGPDKEGMRWEAVFG